MHQRQLVRKKDFAASIGCSPARVSQLIKEGKLHGPALIGAMVDLDEGKRQLSDSLNPLAQMGQNKVPILLGEEPGSQVLPTSALADLEIIRAMYPFELQEAAYISLRLANQLVSYAGSSDFLQVCGADIAGSFSELLNWAALSRSPEIADPAMERAAAILTALHASPAP